MCFLFFHRDEAKVTNNNGGKTPTPANAWARPLQPKRATAPPPGMGPLTSSKPSSNSSSVSFQHRERLLHLSLTLVGRKVILHQSNGAIVEGIFHTFTPFSNLSEEQRNKFVLKETLVKKQPSAETEIKDGITLIVPTSKVVFLHAAEIVKDLKESGNINGSPMEASTSKDAFATDTQISGSAKGSRTNDLVAAGNAWTTGGNSNSNSGYRGQALEGGRSGTIKATNSRAAALAGNKKGGAATINQGLGSSSIGQWDQFKANKELFNVNATFDENLYTTQLDTSQMDAKKMAEAERIAKEIESTTTTNIHMAEERGFKVETDFDEEDLYSGVLTKDGKQRHEKVTITKNTTKEKESKVVDSSSKSNSSSTSSAPRKIMNYAAAAAKADTSKNKSAPPGFSSNGAAAAGKDNKVKDKKTEEASPSTVTPEKNEKVEAEGTKKIVPSKDSTPTVNKNPDKGAKSAKSSEKDEKLTKSKEGSSDKPSSTKESPGKESDKKVEPKDEAAEQTKKKDVKKSSKLNANAKSFTFNPSAKTFTPTFGAGNPPQQPPQAAATADPSMQMYGGVHPMQSPHYLQAGPMGQPGMFFCNGGFLLQFYSCFSISILVFNPPFLS